MPEADASAASKSAHLGARIVRGVFTLVFFGVFLKLGGLLMGLIIARHYGLKGVGGDVTTAYLQVYTIVLYVGVYSTILKFVMPAFMPIFSEERNLRGEAEAWRLANTLLNGVLVIGVILAALAFFFSSDIIRILVPGFTGSRHRIAAGMLRGMAPGILVFAFAVMAMAILNSYKVFSFPSAGEAAQKLTWAASLFLLIYLFHLNRGGAPERPVYLAFLMGCGVQAVILLCGLRKKRDLYQLRLPALSGRRTLTETGIALAAMALFAAWVALVRNASSWLPEGAAGTVQTSSGFFILTGGVALAWVYAALLWVRARKRGAIMGRLAVLIAPLLIGILFARYRDFTQAYFQSYTRGPAFAAIELAKKIVNLPTILVAYSVSIAMMPFLCDLAAERDRKSFGLLFSRAVRMIALFFVPMTLFLVVDGRSIMRLCFDSGDWTAADARQAGLALALYGSGLFFYAVENVLMQAYFSLQRVVVPTFVGIAFSLLQVGALFLCIRGLGLNEPGQIFLIVLIAFPATRALKNLLLLALLRPRLREGAPSGGALFLAKLMVLTAVVAAATWGALEVARRVVDPNRFAGRRWILDTFNPQDAATADRAAYEKDGSPPPNWRGVGGSRPALDTLRTVEGGAEKALRFEGSAAAARAVKPSPLKPFTRFVFKTKCDAPRRLRVLLEDAEGKVCEAAREVHASEARKSHAIPMGDFRDATGAPFTGNLREVRFEDAAPAPAGARLWLDNVGFERPVRRVPFELAKFVSVAVPGLAATFAFLVVCALLRIEEFRIILSWLRARRWRKRPTAPADAGGDG